MRADECPNAATPTHRTGPAGYLARADWSDAMLKTHTQSKCPVCGLWVVWTPRVVDERPTDEAIAEQAVMTEAYYADPDV